MELFSRACLPMRKCGRPFRKRKYFGGNVLLCGLHWFISILVTFGFVLMFSGDGEMTMDEFIEGILRCKGPARAMDQAAWDWLMVEMGTAGSARNAQVAGGTVEDSNLNKLTFNHSRQLWLRNYGEHAERTVNFARAVQVAIRADLSKLDMKLNKLMMLGLIYSSNNYVNRSPRLF